jgi:hypothetical protein
VIGNLSYFIYLENFRYRYIIVHHTASQTGDYQSIKKIHKKERDWHDVAYHLVLNNGSKSKPTGYLEASSRYKKLNHAVATKSLWYNHHGVHLAIVGNYEQSKPNKIMQQSIVNAIELLKQRFHINNNNILMHRDCSATLCPGKHIDNTTLTQWQKQWSSEPEKSIYNQQKNVIYNTHLSLTNIDIYCHHFVYLNIFLILFMAISIIFLV